MRKVEQRGNEPGRETIHTADQQTVNAQAQYDAERTPGEQPTTRTMRGVNSVLRRTINRSSGSALVQTLRKQMEAALVDQNLPADEFGLVSVDPSRFSVPYPALAVVTAIEVAGKQEVFAYVFAMVGGAAPLPKREVVTKEGPVMAPRTWVDNLNNSFITEARAAVKDFMQGSTPTPLNNNQIHMVGFTVVPNTLDTESLALATDLLIAADNALQSMITLKYGQQLGMEKFSLAWTNKDDIVSSIQYNTTGACDSDIVGNPVRSDLTVSMSSRFNRAGQDYDTSNTLLTSTGYLDLLYSPQDPSALMGATAPLIINGIAVPPTAQYQPQFIFTSMYPVSMDAFTHEVFTMGLIGTVTTLTTRNAWMHQYLALARKGLGPQNPGALATILDKETKAPIDLSSQTDEDIYKLLSKALFPSLSLAFDVPEEGESSWLLRDLTAACTIHTTAGPDNVVVYSRAYDRMYTAFDTATAGCFAKLYPKGAPLFHDNDTRIALGHYNHQDNRRHDVRDVDDLYMMNQAPAAMAEFEDSYTEVEQSGVKRYVTRNDLLDTLLGHSWTHTGWARRIEFDPEAVDALLKAAVQCGFRLTPENISAFNGATVRGSQTARSRALGASNQDILKTSAPTGATGNGGMGNNYTMFDN